MTFYQCCIPPTWRCIILQNRLTFLPPSVQCILESAIGWLSLKRSQRHKTYRMKLKYSCVCLTPADLDDDDIKQNLKLCITENVAPTLLNHVKLLEFRPCNGRSNDRSHFGHKTSTVFNEMAFSSVSDPANANVRQLQAMFIRSCCYCCQCKMSQQANITSSSWYPRRTLQLYWTALCCNYYQA